MYNPFNIQTLLPIEFPVIKGQSVLVKPTFKPAYRVEISRVGNWFVYFTAPVQKTYLMPHAQFNELIERGIIEPIAIN